MKFSEFRQYQPKSNSNVFVFICDDDFLVEESRGVWQRLFGGNWNFEKHSAKEFEEIPPARLIDDALTPSLFAQNRAFIVSGAEKLSKSRIEHLAELQKFSNSSLKIVLVSSDRRSAGSWSTTFPTVEIDALKPAEVTRWLVDRYGLAPEIGRYLVENVGTDLYELHTEIEKLQTYVNNRPIEAHDIDMLILRSEQFGPFDLEDAVVARDYRKAVLVMGAMLEEGIDPLRVLWHIARVWRQLFVGKSLAGKKSAKDVAAATMVPAWKAGDFVASCRKFEWEQLGRGFRELLNADRALKASTPNPEGYFDVMLWKLIG